MKKIAILLMLVFVCALPLAACAGGTPEGKYYFDSLRITASGTNLSVNSKSEMWSAYKNFYIEFNEDNTFEMYYDGTTVSGTFEVDGKIKLSMSGEEDECSLSGKTITFTYKEGDSKIVLKFKKPASTVE